MNKFSNRFKELLKRSKAENISKQKQVKPEEVLVFRPEPLKKFPTLPQIQYLPSLLNPSARISFWLSLVVIIIAGIIFSMRWYFRATELVPKRGGSYTEAMIGLPEHINSILAPLSDVDADITGLVFSSLFRYNDNQELVPDLITNYVLSDDKLTYTFFLNPNVIWHDREPLKADDVLFTIAAIQDPLYKSPLQSALFGVQMAKLDDDSFSLTLEEPYAPFLSSLIFGILPEHIWYDVPPQNVALTEYNVRPIGSGPFKFNSLAKDKAGNIKSMKLVRFTDYYREQPYLDEIQLIFYPDTPSAVEALKTKKAQGLSFIPSVDKTEIAKRNRNLEFYSLRLPQYTAIFFNQAKSEILKNDELRRALAYATDREQIIREVLNGEGEAIYTPILPGFLGHNAEVEKYPFNLEESKRLLEEGGWKYPEQTEEQNNGFTPREKEGQELEFTVSTVDRSEYRAAMEILQKLWQEVGVKVNVDYYSPQDIQNTIIKKRNYEALFFGEIVGTDPDPFPFWHSSQQEHPGLALAIFRDREIDQLLEEARKTTDEEQRRLKYLHFQNNLSEEVVTIFLYNPLYTYGVDKQIGNMRSLYITAPSDRWSGITKWYIKTDRKFR